MSSWNKQEFQNFLVEKLNISPRVARDYADRCLRIEREIGIDLVTHTKNANDYISLAFAVHENFKKKNKDKKIIYSLNGIHMNAIRKLAHFIWGKSVVDSYKKYLHRTY